MSREFTAIVHQESLSDGEPVFVAYCPEIDVTTQGETESAAIMNLREAIEALLEVATEAEIEQRLSQGAIVKTFEIAA
jgi:predicted RNase H-like HicB family nuclease